MAEFKKMTKEEVAAVDKKDFVVAKKAAAGEVEGQGKVWPCPYCGALQFASDNPKFVICPHCSNPIHAIWN